MPLLHLPNELLLLIASHLPVPAVLSFTLTARPLHVLLAPTLTAIALSDHRALHWAVRAGRLPLVQHLLDLGVPIDITDRSNSTALHQAVISAHPPIVRLLLDRGAALEIAQRGDEEGPWGVGETPLLLAVVGRSESVVEMLVGAGANVEATGAAGRKSAELVWAWRGEWDWRRVLGVLRGTRRPGGPDIRQKQRFYGILQKALKERE